MIDSIFSALSKKQDAGIMQSAIKLIGHEELFEPIVSAFGDYWFVVVKYILFAYSRDSPYISLGRDWTEIKRKVADNFQIPKDTKYVIPGEKQTEVGMFDGIVSLKIPVILKMLKFPVSLK